MLSEQKFRDVVSGRAPGVGARLLRMGLAALEVPYTAGVRWINGGYDRGRRTVHRVAVPVVSVGNLTLGGTGKTPMVAWLGQWFRRANVRVTVISRGYKSVDGATNDEALELEQKLPDVPHLQNPDRVAAAEVAIDELGCQAIVLDDAFQHRRIHRDLDIVLIDASEPFGYDRVFPRGTLREPVAGLTRADVVVLSRADMLDERGRDTLRRRVEQLAPQALWVEAVHCPSELLRWPDQSEPLSSLSGCRVRGFCGIGNPAGFRHTLGQCSCQLVDLKIFPDHHAYGRTDIDRLKDWSNAGNVDAVVCTHKDLVKIGLDQLGQLPLRAVIVGLRIERGEAELVERLRAITRQPSVESL